MSKCSGCGAKLQNTNINLEGYSTNLENNLCLRCFRIRNYNDYRIIIKDNKDFINILSDINKTTDLVILVIDLFNINKNINEIKKYINNKILLVLTKRDILPKSCYDLKFIEYFKKYHLNIVDTIVISSLKNYNLDDLYTKINKYKQSNKVYVIGYTNSGKSTMINKIIYNYSNLDSVITTSNLPSTTIDSIEVKINNDLTLIDTPGLLDKGDIINYIDSLLLKRIIPTREIKPITYQIKCRQTIIIDKLLRLDLDGNNNLTIYMSNTLNVKRLFNDTNKLKELKKNEIFVGDDEDIVIQGLGFIHVTNASKIILYNISGVEIFIRKSLI